MKNNKLTKLFLSLLVAFTISSTNPDILSQITTISYDSQIDLYGDEPQNSPLEEWPKQ